MAINHRLKKLEEVVGSGTADLPFLIAKDHEDAERIEETCKRAGRKLDAPIIIIDTEPKECQ